MDQSTDSGVREFSIAGGSILFRSDPFAAVLTFAAGRDVTIGETLGVFAVGGIVVEWKFMLHPLHALTVRGRIQV